MAVSKIGVTGWKGRLGSELVRRGCLPLKCDVTDEAWLKAALEIVHPHLVVHCAAITDVDECEKRPGLAAEVNTVGTWNLCRLFNGPIVYLSTDYIFDGRAGPYAEEATPNPLGMYGWSKLGGEIAVRQRKDTLPGSRGKDDLIVRTTILFDRSSENFVTKVAFALLRGETLHLPDDLTGSPTYVPHLAAGILAAVERGIGGVLNLTGDVVMSRYAMGRYIAAHLELHDRILPGPSTGAAARPLNAGLKVDKAKSLGIPVSDPHEGMREVVQHALETVGSG